MILYWNIVSLISFVPRNGKSRFHLSHFSRCQPLNVFFSEVGGGRSSRFSSTLYIVLHVSEPIEVGGVTRSLEPSCNSFFSNFAE